MERRNLPMPKRWCIKSRKYVRARRKAICNTRLINWALLYHWIVLERLKTYLRLRGNDMDFINQIMPSLVDFIAVVVGVGLMYLGQYVKKLYNKYVDDETKKQVVNSTVQYVEQVYKDIHGEEKLEKALERASELLKEKGIAVSNTELETLIESAVCGFNDGFYKG